MALFAHRANQAVGAPIQVVSPSKYADIEAPSAITNAWFNGRIQQVFPASDFESLPPDYRLITQLALRPNGSLGSPLTMTADNVLFQLSTTTTSPLDLSMSFAENTGTDETVLFESPATLSTANVGPPGGPKVFDIVFALQTPFECDPRNGNLLLDETYLGMSTPQSMDWVNDQEAGAQAIWDGSPSSASASDQYGGFVWQFTFDRVPQAGAWLQPGDADQNLEFDQLDLVQVLMAAKYMTGQPATWVEGDWDGAPGGEPGSPPPGNGVFDQWDIVAALGSGKYLTGPYLAVKNGGQTDDNQASVIYNAITGEVGVDAPNGAELTSINIESASGIFTGDPAQNLGGSFDNDADNNIFKATFGSSFGSLSFGNVTQTGLGEGFVANDLTVVGSLAGGGDLGDVDLIYVPEPSTIALLLLGLAGMLVMPRRGST